MHLREISFFSRIDFDRVDLPSSILTIGQLRKRFPTRAEFIVNEEGESLDAMWDLERIIVLLGYASVAGKKAEGEVRRQIPEVGPAGVAKYLIGHLLHYGLADGPESAKQVIQRLKEAGAAIARQQLGRTGR